MPNNEPVPPRYGMHISWSALTVGLIVFGAAIAFFQQDATRLARESELENKVVQLESQLRSTTDKQNQVLQSLAANDASLREIETQICALDSIRNLTHANDLRIISVIWHKTFSESLLPTDNSYYPAVCRVNPTPQSQLQYQIQTPKQ